MNEYEIEGEIKRGQNLSITTPKGEVIEGEVLSILELKEALWISIKTEKGVRITSLSY